LIECCSSAVKPFAEKSALSDAALPHKRKCHVCGADLLHQEGLLLAIELVAAFKQGVPLAEIVRPGLAQFVAL